MGRQARIVDQATDIFGDRYAVREWRETTHGFAVALGWPEGEPRGNGGAGGPRAVLTESLVGYLERLRDRPAEIRLPVGRTTIKRLRRVLGHHWRLDRAHWWEERVADLSDLTLAAFAQRHGVSTAAALNARHAVYGPTLRPAGWWRSPDVAAMILSSTPRAAVAEALDISIGAVGRLRWMLKQEATDA